MSKKVLVIEDNNDIRENVVEILELAGYTVYEADNGKTGVELTRKHLPDIILCDIMMPGLDGYGVLYMLNKDPETGTIPFIFLTAKAEHVDLRKGMEMGADDYLTKPFDDMQLLVAIESRLNKKEQLDGFYSKSLDNLEQLASKSDGLDELKKTIAERKVRQVKKNQTIYHEGDFPQGIYLVLSGRFKTVKLAEDGRELITGIYAKEDYIGINALLNAEPYTETAQAIEDGSLCLLPKDTVDQFLSRFTSIGKKFIQILSNNIREKEEQLLQMAYHSVRKRMAEVLLRLLRQQTTENSNECLKVSREEMASMAGMATETVSRILSDFKDEKLIEKKGSLIQILNKERLAKLKN
ncbi:MAG: transcriptional regulator [Mucilaginibacter sp.]|nr:transcriptional regulator [Mucilaginibacter sp.]